MDGTASQATMMIERNHAALKRVLASLLTMAGLDDGNAAPSTLPRTVYRAVLAVLRPAESAARRLIIAASRGLVVELPVRRKPKPSSGPTPQEQHAETIARMRRLGLAVPPSDLVPAKKPALDKPRSRVMSLPLFDPPRPALRPRKPVQRAAPANAGPRISFFPEFSTPFQRRAPIPPPPAPPPAPERPADEPVDATRLFERLSALAAALDDLPDQARRFARLQASRSAAAARAQEQAASNRPIRFARLSPLRFGRPPGGKLMHLSSTLMRQSKPRPIDEILAEVHALAKETLAATPLPQPDTS